MRNAGAWLIAVVVLLSVGGSGCSRSGRSKELAALDQAYQSGILSKDEYLAKKARLIAKASVLASLERARQAGVFTQEEYLAKKAALLAADTTAAPPSQADTGSAPPVVPVGRAPQPLATAASSDGKAAPSAAAGSQKSAPEASSNAASSAAESHVLRMKMASAIDQSGFERPMPSLSMLIPADWQSQGGTTWNIKDKCNTIQTRLRTTGPDGRALEVFPAFSWVWADDPKPLQMTAAQTAQYGTRPCDVAPPMSAADFLRRNLNRYRPNAQLVGFEPAPKVLAQFQQQAREGERSAAQYNLKQSIRPDVIKARLRYSVNGQAMEEWIVVATVTTATLGPSYNSRTMQMGQSYTYSCVAYATGERAPQGKLDASEKLFELVAGTSHWNPAWQAKVNGNAQAIQAIELKGVRDRSAIVTKNAEEIANIRRQSYENTQRSQDQIYYQNSQNMRGVETYRNPATGETVDLSNQYGQAWVNNRGEYLLSDRPGFDPSVTFKEDWKPLEKVNK